MAPKTTEKDMTALLDEADGHPQWLREALEEIWRRLPPKTQTPAPLTWDPRYLARLQLDPGGVPLTKDNRWYLATWLKKLAKELSDGTFPEGDSHEGFRTVFVLGQNGGKE
jgi:hypothetical protein